jgi:sugar phosphate isomerase/epimerase
VRIFDPDEARAIESFRRLGELAASYGLTPSIEYAAYKTPEALFDTLRIIERAGFGALSIDPLHLVRSEASFDVIRGLDPNLVGYAQLCDGPASATEAEYQREMAEDRLAPGEGAFPLAEIVDLVPPGRPLSLEVLTQRERLAGVPAEARARCAVEAARKLLGGMAPA